MITPSKLIDFRCMEHTIYLAAGDFVKAVGPKTKSWNKNRPASVEDADNNYDTDDDSDDSWAADWNQLELLPDEQAIDDEIDFEAGDTLGKALALVNQVSLDCCMFFDLLIFFFRFVRHLRQKFSSQSVAMRKILPSLSFSSGFEHDGVQCMISLTVSWNVERFFCFLFLSTKKLLNIYRPL